MNRSRDKVRCALNHQNAGSIPVDFGSTAVTGIHCRIVEALRNYYGLAPRPVKIVDAFQMLGEIDAELAEKIGLTKQQITKYETGSSTPSYDVLKKICLELNTSANWLMGITLRNDI